MYLICFQSPYLSSLIPSAYVWLISKLVPPIVKFLPKWTASENNPHADQPYVTVKIYAYLLYTIVLLPSIGLPNIQVFKKRIYSGFIFLYHLRKSY